MPTFIFFDISDGIDPHTYDFNKEWIPYWEKRLQEFHAKEIVRQKFETKRKLKLSYDARSPSPVRRRRRSRSPPRRRSPSPRSRQPRARSRSYDGPPIPKRSRHIDSDESITVCSVMRLLTALEDHLGSLGPQAVQLLSRAVLTEKVYNVNFKFYIFFIAAMKLYYVYILKFAITNYVWKWAKCGQEAATPS